MSLVVIPTQAGIHLPSAGITEIRDMSLVSFPRRRESIWPSAGIVKDVIDAILLRFEKMIENERSAALTPTPLPEGEGFVLSPLPLG